METYNNYWRINVAELPSRGLNYDRDISIRGRTLNLQEIKYLSTLNDETATDIISEIFNKCFILENLRYEDLYLADREWLIFWLRVNSFKEQNGYTLNLKCTGCGKEINQNFKLVDFDIKYIDVYDNHYDGELPDSGLFFEIDLPKVKDVYIRDEDGDIEKIARNIHFTNVDKLNNVELIKSMSAMDFMYLKSIVDRYEIGFIRHKIVYCPECNTKHRIELVFSETGLFSQMNLFEIMEIVVQICKYTHYQITENTPWIEIEVLQEVVNKIAKEEKEHMDKTSKDMKTSMPSLASLRNKIRGI